MTRALFPFTVCALIATALCAYAGVWQEPNPIAKIVTTKDEAFGVFPAQMVVPGLVREFKISPDGRYILAVRVEVPKSKTNFFLTEEELFQENFPATLYITAYDRVRDQAFELYRVPTKDIIEFDVTWSAEPGVAILSMTYGVALSEDEVDVKFSAIRLSAADRSSRVIYSSTPSAGSNPRISIVPKAAFYYIFDRVFTQSPGRWKYSHLNIQMFDTKGNLVARMTSNEPTLRYMGGRDIEYLKDGVTPVFWMPEIPSTDGSKPRPGTYIVDVRSQALTTTDEKLEFYRPPVTNVLTFSHGRHILEKGGVREVLEGLWLEAVEPSEKARVFLDVHPTDGQIAPDMTYLAYVANGALFIRQIERMSLSEYRTAEETSVKKRAMNQAKMVGTAAHIYSADYDDYFPMAHNFKDALMPYTKNESIFEGFIYVFTGGSITAVENVSTTAMGYVETPFGRAVVYVDSSVRWEPKK